MSVSNTSDQRSAPSPTGDALDTRSAIVAATLLVILTALAIWWPLKAGGFFPTVFLPGAILLYAALVVLLVAAPLPLRLSRSHWMALGGLLALAIWTATTIGWTPAQDIGLEDAQRTMTYPVAFFAGLWLSALLRNRPALALAPWIVGAVVVAVVTGLQVLGAERANEVIDPDGTLEFPFGYRNANALFFLLCCVLLVGSASRRGAHLAVQMLAGAGTAACLSLAILCQSRGSVLAVGAGALVLLALFPHRLRLAAIGVASIAPTLALLPELLDPFAAASDDQPVLAPMQEAVRLIPLAALAAALLVAMVSLALHRWGRRTARPTDGAPRWRLWSAGGLAAAAAIAALAIVADPLDRLSDLTGGDASTRYTYTGGLGRTDYYAVAFDQFQDAPLWGEGSGSFRTRYALERDTDELPRDAHSLELETLGELGLVGTVLLLVAAVGLVAGAWKARSVSDESKAIAATALAVAAAWTAQASIDWFSSFPALTTLVLALLGIAAGPLAHRTTTSPGRRVRAVAVAPLVVATLIAAPTFVSERYTLQAASSWQQDPDRAFDRLDRAADLNPLADTPLQVKAQIARNIDQPELAQEAIDEAEQRQPEEWRSYLIEATILAERRPLAAREQLRRASELNPLSPEVEGLLETLEGGRAPGR